MHQGKLTEAEALTTRIRGLIENNNSNQLKRVSLGDPKAFWDQINTVMGKNGRSDQCCIDANVLNDFFAAFSKDDGYITPVPKQTCSTHPTDVFISEHSVFHPRLGTTITCTGVFPI